MWKWGHGPGAELRVMAANTRKGPPWGQVRKKRDGNRKDRRTITKISKFWRVKWKHMVLIWTVSLLSCGGVSLKQSDVQHSAHHLLAAWLPMLCFSFTTPFSFHFNLLPQGRWIPGLEGTNPVGSSIPRGYRQGNWESSYNTPDLLGGSEKPLGLQPLEDRVLTTLLYVNINCTIYCFSSLYEVISWKCDVTQRWQVTPDWYQVLRDP